MKLYKRNAKGDPIVWEIQNVNVNPNTGNSFIRTFHGVIGGKMHEEIIPVTKIRVNEIDSRVKAKIKEGYKTFESLWDNAPDENKITDKELKQYLNTYLPKNNTTGDGFVLPMLAKTLEDNKPFEKKGDMLGQWKINGLRCIIGVERRYGDIFNPFRVTYTSREGVKWNLSWMDDLIIKSLNAPLLDMMIQEGVCLDGELYLPGYSVNDINSFVKNDSLPQHRQLQYWCYDLCAENMSANSRQSFLDYHLHKYVYDFITKESHLNNKVQFVVLPTYNVVNITNAIDLRDKFIDRGFEGLIIRDPQAEYAFGKRNSSMFKYKKKVDGLFEVVDIKEDKRGLPIYTLQNDINSEYFECTINLPQDGQRQQLAMKNLLIGKKAFVEYRERSGVKQVPFHAKIINIQI